MTRVPSTSRSAATHRTAATYRTPRRAWWSQPGNVTPTQNTRIREIQVLHQNALRMRASSNDGLYAYDSYGADGFSDVFVARPSGQTLLSLTSGHASLTVQRHMGNAVISPDNAFVIFQVEEWPRYESTNAFQADPGYGIYCNLWAYRIATGVVTKLTATPIKQTAGDGVDILGNVMPFFSRDGTKLIWTRRRGGSGIDPAFGYWDCVWADWTVTSGTPSLTNITILYAPMPPNGNYIIAKGQLSATSLLVSGNLDGQPIYEMGHYAVDISTIPATSVNVTGRNRTLGAWEEGTAINYAGQLYPSSSSLVALMTNKWSPYDETTAEPGTPKQRDLRLTDVGLSFDERLTYFNDPTAPEYVGDGITCETTFCWWNSAGTALYNTAVFQSKIAPYTIYDIATLRIVFDV